MKQSTNKIIKQYYQTLEHRLPYIPKAKKQFLTMIRNSMKEYANIHPSASTVDFQQEFGTIEQLVEDYKDFVSAKQMVNTIQRTHYLNHFLSVMTLALIVFLLMFLHDLHFKTPAHIEIRLEIETES